MSDEERSIIADFLSAELNVTLRGGESREELGGNPAEMAALRAIGFDEVAKALGRGAARGGELGVECIAVLVAALQMSGEADLEEEWEWFLSVVGNRVRIVEAGQWIEALLSEAEQNGRVLALETLAQLAERWKSSMALAETIRRAMPRLLALLDGALSGYAAAVLREVLRHETPPEAELALPRLIEMLADPELRDVAANVLGLLRDPRAIAPLVALLEDPNVSRETKSYNVTGALRELRAAAAVAPLLALLGEPCEPYERGFYIHALADLDPAAAAPVVARIMEPAEVNAHSLRILDAGAQAGDAASLDLLERIVRTKGHLNRSAALSALARARGHLAFEQLCAAAIDKDEFMRAAAVARLREMRTVRAFDALVGALELGQPNAARALFELGDLRAIKPLTDALERVNPHPPYDVMTREAVIEALGDFAHDEERVWARLVGLLTHRSDHLGECAAIALQQIRPGCRSGVTQLVRKISRIPRVPALLARNTLPIVTRLLGAARRGVLPYDTQSVATILAALRDLQPTVEELPDVRAPLAELIETWDAWLASARS